LVYLAVFLSKLAAMIADDGGNMAAVSLAWNRDANEAMEE